MSITKCYLCKAELTEDNISVEHIIPQSLGGKLISDKLLCKSCNTKLGIEIDARFTKTFEPLICTLDIIGREKSSKTIPCKIILTHEEMDGILSDGKLQPAVPQFTLKDKDLRFYGSKKLFASYKYKIEKDAQKHGLKFEELKINIIDDIRAYFKVDFNLDSKNFHQALTKMAIDFAINSGIPVESLNHLIDSTTKTLHSAPLIPYIPLTDFEKAIERVKVLIDPDYPNHTLILFTENLSNKKKMLVCFVDLFSTFQYYVILSDEYLGSNIFQSHWQRVLKGKVVPYEIDQDAPLSKHDLPDIQELEARFPLLDTKNISGEKLKVQLKTYLSQPKAYIEDYSSFLERLFNNISLPLMCGGKSEMKQKLGDRVRKGVLDKLEIYDEKFCFNCIVQMGQHYFIYTEERPDIVLEKNFRRITLDDHSISSVFNILTVKYVTTNDDIIKKYCAEKFDDFIDFKNKLFMERKSKYYNMN